MMIKTYHPLVILTHKFVLALILILTITGLPLFSKIFSFLAYTVGYPASIIFKGLQPLASGIMIFRTIHWIAGYLLTITVVIFFIVMLIHIRKLNIFPERWSFGSIKDGLVQMKRHYVDGKPAKFGKYNMGQKVATWAIIILVAILLVTGVILVYKDLNPGAFELSTGAVLVAIHSVCFIILIITLLGHAIFALLPSNGHALRAMFISGETDLEYIKKHHPYWYEKLKRRGEITGD